MCYTAPVPAPVIKTPRLRLRGWSDGDSELWAALNADPRVTEFFPGPIPREVSAAQAALMREALERDGYGWWVLELRSNRAFAGVITLQDVPFVAAFTPAYEVGWRLAPDLWGNGYATEGAKAALEFARATLGWQEVVAMTAALNSRSQRVMQRLSMTCDPKDDFDHPRIEEGHPMRRHVLYRKKL